MVTYEDNKHSHAKSKHHSHAPELTIEPGDVAPVIVMFSGDASNTDHQRTPAVSSSQYTTIGTEQLQ